MSPEKRPPKVCICAHPFRAHNQWATTGRTNGPTSKRACSQCDCWRPVEQLPLGL